MGYIQSFDRYEKKYILTMEQFSAFLEKTSEIIRPDSYGQYTICSIYLDTEDYMFIRNSIEKPVYKEKLRLRSYGVPDENDSVFFEIKKKYRGIVYKRRISAAESDLYDYAVSGVISERLAQSADAQILSEIDYIMRKYHPVPKVCVAYDRQAFEGISDTSLRVTFDSAIRCRTDRLRLSSGNGGEHITVGNYGSDYRLMEIKTGSAVPYELVKILSELKIYPASFSKYGEIYKQIILPKLIEKKGCAVKC